MTFITYTVSPEREQGINESIAEQLTEIEQGYDAIMKGSTRISLLQGVGRIESACTKLTYLANLIK
jgi:hypothetical protein